MSKINELIEQLCPVGVFYEKLDELFIISRGRVMSKEYLRDNAGSFSVYSSQTANNGEIGKIKTFDYNGEFLTWTTDGANAGTVFYRNEKFSITNVCGLLKSKSKNIHIKFAYYYLSFSMKKYVSSGMGNPKLMSNVVEKIAIPLPPLPIQQEIVTILDKFTQLEAELEAELEARKKQYEYYRDELLNYEGKDVMRKPLDKVCQKTENIKWKEHQNIDVQYIDLSSVNRENNKITETQTINSENAPSRAQQIINMDDVIFGTTRPTLKRYSFITSKHHNQICSTGFCVLRSKQDELLPKFLFYILTTTSFYNYVDINQEGAGYPSISNSSVKKYEIPLPPLPEQERIVAILDKFDALVNDISEGLPAEIQARRKQYVYYRGLLLDFKRSANE